MSKRTRSRRTAPGLRVEHLEDRAVPATLLTPGANAAPADADTAHVISIATDGSAVLFASKANNLVAGATDGNGLADLFYRDLAANKTYLVTAKTGNQAGGYEDLAGNAVLSGNGKFVAFVSKTESKLLTGDAAQLDLAATNDVFLWSFNGGTPTIRLVSADKTGNGSKVAVGNLAGVEGTAPNISADGTFVAYVSNRQTNQMTAGVTEAGDTTTDIFRRNMTADNTAGAATEVATRQGAGGFFGFAVGNQKEATVLAGGRYMSQDGRFVAYTSKINTGTFIEAGVTDDAGQNTPDVIVRDMTLAGDGSSKVVSKTVAGNAIGKTAGLEATGAVVSRDGSTIVFASNAPGGADDKQFVAGFTDNSGAGGIDLYALTDPFGARAVALVNAKDGTTNVTGNAAVVPAAYDLTPNGKVVLFHSVATDLVDPALNQNGAAGIDVFVRDRTGATPVTELISVGSNGKTGTTDATGTSLTDDGRFVPFRSASAGLVAQTVDNNGVTDVFVRDRTADTTRARSTNPAGRATGNGESPGGGPTIGTGAGVASPDGKFVAFTSVATNLVSPPLAAGTTSNLYRAELPAINPLDLAAKLAVSGTATGQAEVFRFDPTTGQLVSDGGAFAPFGGFTGDVRAAVGDFDGDGLDDVAYGVGPTGGSQVRVRTAAGADVVIANVYEADFKGGVFLAAGDVDGDGRAELVVSPDQGGGGRTVIFRLNAANNGLDRVADFLGIDDKDFRGGARVAFGDVSGDGALDLIVAAGFGGGPRVAIYSGAQLLANPNNPPKLRADFFVFEQTLRNGTFVSAGDFTGDGKAEVAFGGGPGGGPRVLVLNGIDVLGLAEPATGAPVSNFFAGDVNQRGGVRLTTRDIDGDARADLVTGSGEGFASQVRTYLGKNVVAAADGVEPTLLQAFNAFGGAVSAAGVYVG